jgi:hypothetical protein
MSRRFARLVTLLGFLSFVVLSGASVAYAGYEGTATPAPFECEQCHTPPDETTDYGPHGSFVSSSNKCASCHMVHASTGAYALLPGPTVKATCELCHDGTGGGGVYGALAARGVPVLGSHRVDVTNVVPGGSAVSGQDTTRTFVGSDGFLGCDDCHSPHASNTVAEFQGERYRGNGGMMFGFDAYPDAGPTSKLLKRRPTGAATETLEYGSDWCAACHAGRTSGGVVHNHPADSLTATSAPFDYNHVAVLDSAARTTGTILRSVTDGTYESGWAMDNRAYLMPDPRTPQQSGHYPICQQCHEDARNVGTLTGAGALAAPLVVTPGALTDQYPVTDNPRFQNFPHETASRKLLVETDDDLCTNCHLPENLP